MKQRIGPGVIYVRYAVGGEILPGVGPAPHDSFEPAGPLDVFKGALVQGDLTGLSWLCEAC